MFHKIGNINWNLFAIYSIIILFLFFIFRASIPLFKYPFIIIFFILVSSLVFKYKNLNFFEIKRFIYIYSFVLTSMFLLITSIFFSNKIYILAIKEFFNSLIILVLFFLTIFFVQNDKSLKIFIKNTLIFILIFTFIISLNDLFKTLNIYSGNGTFFAFDLPSHVEVDSVQIDYNFAVLPIFFSLFILLSTFINDNKFYNKFLLISLYYIYIFSILLSGSKRALFFLIFLVIFLISINIFGFFKKKSIIVKLIIRKSYYFIIAFFSLILILFIFFRFTDANFKNQTFRFVGCNNISLTKNRILQISSRYVDLFKIDISYDKLYEFLWTPSFNPKDPESGWGARVHTNVFPLSGSNVEIVPIGSRGYMMDKTCNSFSWDGNSYSFTKIFTLNVSNEEIINSSVFCYVSKDFNGEWVGLVSEGALQGQHMNSSLYDFTKKGTWQKLKLKSICVKGELRVLLYFSMYGVPDFSTLTGYVIFAYPSVDVNDFLSMDSYITHKSNYYELKTNRFNLFINNEFIRKEGFFNYFSLPSVKLNMKSDPLRDVLSKFQFEDTVYVAYNSEIETDTLNGSFLDLRISRWKFAIQIFQKEYNLTQKIFGGGFNFLNWYGYYFLGDKTKTDYPHNPFLHILLYSGIVGVLLYILLLYKVFYYYIKYIKEYYLFFIFFLITYFFTFFSGGNPFDPPIMGFFMMLPFFIHYIHEKDKTDFEKQGIKLKIQGLVFKIRNFRSKN